MFRKPQTLCRGGLMAAAIAAAALALPSADASAADLSAFAGKYDMNKARCGKFSDSHITIKPRSLAFHEGKCDLVSVRPSGVGAAVIASFKCSAEGESYTSSAFIGRDEHGELTIFYSTNYGATAHRCGK